ncbi:thermonuclease family protein [Marinospirillum perlucidum]|uniref:thermonuclease family protein n=1 Tax=Marinospirillum perlucidum TaxID=1982602 RepID=UPI000DF4B5C0|nr:thermonuclease family protein [Marinospirillum perlucidum]
MGSRWLFLLLLLLAFSLQAEPCSQQQLDREAAVTRVYDADTLTLADGTRVRLLGIDAPEMGRNGQPSEAFAVAGRDYLRQLLANNGQRVRLDYGVESRDRHGRLLAYAFLPDGRNINRLLLEAGYVMQMFVAPDTRYATCLQPYEDQALQAGRGIWSLAENQPGLAATEITSADTGGARVYGRVVRVARSRHNLWINLQGRLALQIPAEHLPAFEGLPLEQLEGRRVRTRGWLVEDRNRYQDWRLQVTSPLALEVLD